MTVFNTLISTAELAARIDDPQLVLVDVRHQLVDPAAGENAYRTGHLPGAHFLHIDRDLSSPMNGRNGRHPLPDPVQLAQTLGRIGIGSGTQVVVYDDLGGMMAGRLWWLLRWLGHDAVALLDGGLQAWQRAGLPLTQDAPAPNARTFEARMRPDLLVGVDAVLANLSEPRFLVLDARTPERYRGEGETLDPVGGHIPGALVRCFRDNLTAEGEFKPAGQLREAFSQLLAGRVPQDLVHQCGSGVSACLNVLAMEHAGLSGSRLYAGSWSEWCADPARPVAR